MILSKEEIFNIAQRAKSIPAGSEDFFALSEEQLMYFAEMVVEETWRGLSAVLWEDDIR